MPSLRPFEAGDWPFSFEATFDRAATGAHLTYVLRGDLGGVRFGAPGAPRRADGLWEHTCFEAFLRPVGGTAYWEVNLAPSGAWNLYHFSAYRTGHRPEERLQLLASSFSIAGDEARLQAQIPLDALPELRGSLQIGLTAVLEHAEGAKSYWALLHPGPKPDFHLAEGFIVAA